MSANIIVSTFGSGVIVCIGACLSVQCVCGSVTVSLVSEVAVARRKDPYTTLGRQPNPPRENPLDVKKKPKSPGSRGISQIKEDTRVCRPKNNLFAALPVRTTPHHQSRVQTKTLAMAIHVTSKCNTPQPRHLENTQTRRLDH